MSRVFLKYVDNSCTVSILGSQLRSRGWVFEHIQLVRSGRMQDARYCNAFISVWDDQYAAYLASELNGTCIPGVGTVQAEIARPRNNATAGTQSKASPPGVPLVPTPPKCPPPAHLLPAAKMQAAPLPMETPPMVEVPAAATMENPPMVEVPAAAAASVVEDDGYDEEEEEIGDEELQRFLAEHAATSPAVSDGSRSRSQSSRSTSSTSRSRSRRRRRSRGRRRRRSRRSRGRRRRRDRS